MKAVAEAKTALDDSDIRAIRRLARREAPPRLVRSSQGVYADARARTAGNNGAASNPSEPNVDAELQVVDDDKNRTNLSFSAYALG